MSQPADIDPQSPSEPVNLGFPPRHNRSHHDAIRTTQHQAQQIPELTRANAGDSNEFAGTSPRKGTRSSTGDSNPQAREQPVTHLDFSVPRNTGVVGAVVTRSTLYLPSDIPFADFWSRVCDHMGLDATEAELGYKYSVDQARDPPRSLTSEDELRKAIEHGQGLVRRARTRKIEIIIHNLKPATKSAVSIKNQKRKVASSETTAESPAVVVDFTDELRKLKEHLLCATHHGRWCYVSPVDGNHQALDIFTLTLWAKKMLLKEATLREPPNILQFDHPTKKRRTSPATRIAASSGTAPAPAIHVHLNNIPLDDMEGQRRVNREVGLSRPIAAQPPSDVSDDTLIAYPSIKVLLSDLERVMPDIELMPFYTVFTGKGIFYVDSIEDLDDEFLVSSIGLPCGITKQFRKHAARLVRRAEKAVKVKSPEQVDAEGHLHDGEKENDN